MLATLRILLCRFARVADVIGDSTTCGFNYIYILDVLKAVSCDTVTMKFRDESSPARIDVEDFTHIIMPVRGK